jgi:hypothetical protein
MPAVNWVARQLDFYQELKGRRQMRKGLGLFFLFVLTCTASLFAQSDRKVIFPRFASGDGWTSEFFFSNQGISSKTIKVYFYDENGANQTVETNLGIKSNFTINLNGGGTQAIYIDSTGAFKQGYVLCSYPVDSAAIRGSQIYRYELDGNVRVEVGVPQQELLQHFSFPVEVRSDQSIYTAIALSKPKAVSADPEYIVVSLINPNGTIRATQKVLMQSGEHLVGYIDNADWLFPGLNDFAGTISISSPWGIGVLTLRQDKAAFGATATDSGPMVGSFALEDPIIQEAETNDEASNAQSVSLPTIIAGKIGSESDQDVFKFTGRAGAVLTVICDTTQLDNSSLDSLLYVYDNQLALVPLPDPIAFNDQNGLVPGMFPQNDSFIQIVLPADGTYYILLADFDSEGGTYYEYRLHASLR